MEVQEEVLARRLGLLGAPALQTGSVHLHRDPVVARIDTVVIDMADVWVELEGVENVDLREDVVKHAAVVDGFAARH